MKNTLSDFKKRYRRFKHNFLAQTNKHKKCLNKEKLLENSRKSYKFVKKNTFFSFVIIPIIILAFYYLLIATPRYESSAIVSLRQNDSASMVDSSISSFFGGTSPNTSNSYLLIDYMLSPEMLDLLQKDINIKSFYQNRNIDFISRLSSSADKQNFLDYYDSMLQLNYNPESNAIAINAQGYTPEQAQNILKEIVKNSQKAIDYITQTLAKNRMDFSKEQLEIVKKQALDAQQELINFQHNKGIVDPEGSFATKSSVVSELQGKLSEAETRLTSTKLYLNEESAEVKSIEQEIQAIKTQLVKERAEFLNEKSDIDQSEAGIKDLVSDYQWLKLNAEFKMAEYKAALQAFEASKIDTSRQQSFLVEVMKPTLPDTPKYPRTWYSLMTIFIILSAMYGILRMIVTIILEHR
ncbi:capsular polysaccharide transport system permease protein [Allofrancisella inopinata]|uniref:Sugar ABC transporter n=1 Tax=Allofrancisella inopinata TaxID=1085647 RepID=A0AAE7CR19_9GAMM|nr:sugar ABC transporter [Allofrancisella inopinata]QIV96511.1 sugar ABC transporter [Allofrancisella inopinata]TDT68494.1 capsular polysaccharide transport system permease protein [Allofrancisella inopinata]